jgi:hypothetical protein
MRDYNVNYMTKQITVKAHDMQGAIELASDEIASNFKQGVCERSITDGDTVWTECQAFIRHAEGNAQISFCVEMAGEYEFDDDFDDWMDDYLDKIPSKKRF